MTDKNDPVRCLSLKNLAIDDWKKADIKIRYPEDTLLFYRPFSSFNGFDFMAIQLYQSDVDGKNPLYEVVFSGIACFDGIRHFHLGSEQTDNYGYLYYIELDDFIPLLQGLRELENKFCWYKRQEREEPE